MKKKRSTRRVSHARTAESALQDESTVPAIPDNRLNVENSPSDSVRSILGECAAAICLVEVTMHSLQSREIGHPEQEVLKRALKLIWSVHDWIDESNPGYLDDQDDDGEDEP